jgi:hypothetical protein
MGKKLVSKTAKVLSETKKSKDKEAVAIAYEHIPRNPEEQAHGSLYAVIEVEDSGGHAEEIAESIIDALHKEYYEDLTKDSLSAFESSLAKINEELAERSSEGQINWLGKLNAVLGVLSESTLHLTQTGKAEAYLYRGEHEMHITEDLSGDSVNPLRTFINVASGDLTEKDRVAMVTPGVFYKISKSELKKYATEGSPKMAIEDLSQVLAGENGTALPNALMLLEMLSPESFAVEPEPEVATEAWVKEEKKPLEEVSDKSLHGAAKAIDFIGKATAGASAFITTKAFPAIKTGAGKVMKGFKKDADAENIIIDSEEKVSPLKEPEISDSLEVETETSILEGPLEETPRENEIRIKEQKPSRLSLERFNFSGLGKYKERFSAGAKKIRIPGGKFSMVYLIIGIVLAGALLGYLFVNNNNKKQLTAAENTYKQAVEKYDQAVSEIGAGQRSQAILDLATAEKLANDVKNTKFKNAEADKLLTDISTAKDRAMGIIKNTATVFADFGKGNLGGLFSDGTVFYGVSYENGSVYVLDPKAKTVGTIVENPGIEGKILFSNLVVKRKVIVLYTDQKTLYEIDLATKKASKQSVSGGLEDAVAMASYGTNIYLLSPVDNQIYKHTKTTSGYGQKTKYIATAESAEVTNAISLGIDSDVYTVSSDGFLKKYTAGKRQTYNVNGLPENITSPSSIYVDADVSGVYVTAQGNRVIKIDDKQNFVAQYITDEVSDIKGVVVDDDTSTIFMLSGGKIYSASF